MKMMTGIVWKFIKNKKNWNAFLITLFSVLCASVLLTNGIFTSTQYSLFQLKKTEHGAWHGAFYQVNPKLIEQQSKEEIKEDGWIGVLGTYMIKGQREKVTAGFFDKSACKIGCIRLQSGRMPERETEIAVEKSKLRKLGSQIKLGDQVILKSGSGIEKTYTICGIIKDYTGSWDVPENLIDGENTLPEVFMNSSSYRAQQWYYLFQYNFKGKEFDSSKIQELADQCGVDENNTVWNQKTYGEGMELIMDLQGIRILFLTVLCILIFALEIFLMPIYFGQYKDSYGTFELCGMGRKKLFYLKGIHCFILLVLIFMGTALIYEFGTYLLQKLVKEDYSRASGWILWIVFLVLFLVGVCLLFVRKRKTYQMLSGAIDVKDGGWFRNLHRFLLKKGFPFFVPMILACVMIFSSGFYAFAYLNDSDWGDWDDYADFNMAAKTTVVSVKVGEYEVYQEPRQYFTFDQIHKLERMEGISKIEKEPDTAGIGWFREGNSPVYDLNYQILSDQEIIELQKKYPQYPMKKLLQDHQILIYMPKNTVKSQWRIKKNQELVFGRAIYRGRKDLANVSKDDLHKTMLKQKVAGVLEEKSNISQFKVAGNKPVIVMREANVKKIIKGYYQVQVFLKKSATEEQSQKIQDQMQDMAAMHTDFMWASKKEQQLENNKIQKTIGIPLGIFLTEMMFYLVSIFIVSMLMHIEQIRDQIAIFQIYGTRKNDIKKALTLEIWCYFGIVLLAVILCILGIVVLYSTGISMGYIKVIGIIMGILIILWIAFSISIKKCNLKNDKDLV